MTEIKKIDFDELRNMGLENQWEEAVVVFKQESFTENYTEKQRSYEVSSSDKYFTKGMLGSGLHGDCLDGKDLGVRLDQYIHAEKGAWQVDYCYIIN